MRRITRIVLVGTALLVACSNTPAEEAIPETVSDGTDSIVIADEQPMTHRELDQRILVEVVRPVSLEIRHYGDLAYEVHEAEVVSVHSKRSIELGVGDPIQFYTGRADFGNLLDGIDTTESIFLLVKPVSAAGALEVYGSDLQVIYAFTTEANELRVVPRQSTVDRSILETIRQTSAQAQARGFGRFDGEIVEATGRLLDVYNDPESGLRDQLVAADQLLAMQERNEVLARNADPTDRLLEDESYAQLEIAGTTAVVGGSFVVGLSTPSGVSTGFLVSYDAPWITAAVPVREGEPITFSVWQDEGAAFVASPDTQGAIMPNWTERIAETHAIVLTVNDDFAVEAELVTSEEFETRGDSLRPEYKPIPITPEPRE